MAVAPFFCCTSFLRHLASMGLSGFLATLHLPGALKTRGAWVGGQVLSGSQVREMMPKAEVQKFSGPFGAHCAATPLFKQASMAARRNSAAERMGTMYGKEQKGEKKQ